MEPSAKIQVKVGDCVKGGASILAFVGRDERDLVAAGTEKAHERS
jgi:hypothetical protein